ncbi:xanthine dehydrogenase family protein molybdopterin-binding subunit [Sporosarcina koreensis]|uniref:Xanthine dehydrogenase family protein molybdopterin-binding subunit n=1 Tax=Sporosarcina koreensis TaxID=334735 RepID=A0ABW0TZT9_9BACL
MTWSIGKDVQRKDAIEKVSGTAKYTADYSTTDMLHVKLVTSPHAHALLKKIDIKEAEKVKGVKAILVGEPFPLTGDEVQDRPILAFGKVRYYGEPVAAVVAKEAYQAKQAADSIKVTYEKLPVIHSPKEAIQADSLLIHEKLANYKKVECVYPEPNTNIANRVKIRKGSVEKGMAESDVFVEEVFSIPPSDHIAIETRSVIAEIKRDGSVHITSSTQAPYRIREKMSEYFNLEIGKITVTAPFVGGGFGGKVALQLELIAYIASKAVGGRPVKLHYTREEDMVTAPGRIGLEAKVKLGATKEGKLKAGEIEYLFDTGAYSDKGTMLVKAAAATCTGPYDIEHLWCDSLAVYTNHSYATAYRGFSHSEILFAFERAMDILAQKLDMDPLLIREINTVLPGSTTPTQVPLNGSSVGNLPACIKKLKEQMKWDEGMLVQVDSETIRAKGISCSWKTSTIDSSASSGVTLLFNPDGSINVLSGIVEIGMGTKTTIAQLLAEKLKMDINKIHVQMTVNTQSTPEHYKTAASRGTLMVGRALLNAAEDVIVQLKTIAAQVLICSPDDLEVANERVFIRDEPETFIPIKEICYGYRYPNGYSIGGQIIGRGTYTMRQLTNIDKETGIGKTGPEYTVGAQGVEIEFNSRDFTYKILNAYSVIDAGEILNMKMALGQIMGGMSMGLNHASSETLIMDKGGHILNPRIRTYGSFRFGDHPNYIVDFIETPHIDGPFGARGIGESGLIGMPAALANSLSIAAGVKLNHLPLTPEAIWAEKKAVKGQ